MSPEGNLKDISAREILFEKSVKEIQRRETNQIAEYISKADMGDGLLGGSGSSWEDGVE